MTETAVIPPATKSILWKFWEGEILESSPEVPLSLDTETTVVDLTREVPQLVLASASDGNLNVIIKPEYLDSFLGYHEDSHIVFHNIAFDFWVISNYLPKGSFISTLWWRMAEEGRLHDTMLLDMLVRLARGEGETPNADEGGKFHRRSLSQLAKIYKTTYSFTEKEKGTKKKKRSEEEEFDEPIRKRYGELLSNPDWSAADPAFFEYAAKDVYTTWELYPRLVAESKGLLQPFKADPGILPDAVERYGLLTEKIQVLGAIALAQVGRNGILIDREQARTVEESLRARMEDNLNFLKNNYRRILKFKKYKKTGLEVQLFTPATKTPCLAHKELQQVLKEVSEEKEIPVVYSEGKKQNNVSTAPSAWEAYKDLHPFLKAWVGSAQLTVLLGFFDVTRDRDYFYCRYNPLVRTGRTSAEGRIQQWPKDPEFRKIFIARPGYKILTVDFAGIELRAFAAICLRRFGRSRFAEVFKAGPPRDDAHSYTTSLILKEPFEHVLAHKKQEPYSKMRTLSKALAFGRMGGLGPTRFVGYAASDKYRVTVTEEESRDLIKKLHEAYPELDDWLSSSHLKDFSKNLQIPETHLESMLRYEFQDMEPDTVLTCLVKVLYGKAFKVNGEPYSPYWVQKLWQFAYNLRAISPRRSIPDEITKALVSKTPSPKLSMFFSSSTAVTMTGRIRSGISFTEAKNTPFQGLTADGAKLSMWRLIKEGYRVLGFLHDEVLVEVPEQEDKIYEDRINKILCEEMEKTMDGLVPISVESHLAYHWQK